jgi:uncharacterized DUF497 family protein
LQYNFEWDPEKAKLNKIKHKISFENSATIFKDPRAITLYDSDHSGKEERWITLGLSSNGILLVVNHTYEQIDSNTVIIRIISSRKATKHEQKQYKEELN